MPLGFFHYRSPNSRTTIFGSSIIDQLKKENTYNNQSNSQPLNQTSYPSYSHQNWSMKAVREVHTVSTNHLNKSFTEFIVLFIFYTSLNYRNSYSMLWSNPVVEYLGFSQHKLLKTVLWSFLKFWIFVSMLHALTFG